MGAGHAHGHAGARHRWRLAVTFAMVAAFFVVELTVGILTGSLALLSDAGHMAADVVALGAALLATAIATRPDLSGRRTYGSYRAEVLASGFTVLVMLGVAAYILVEAWSRRGEPVEVQAGPMLVVGGRPGAPAGTHSWPSPLPPSSLCARSCSGARSWPC